MIAGVLTLLSTVLGQTAFPEPLFLSMFPVSVDAGTRAGTVEIRARTDGPSFGELTRRRAARYRGEGHFVATIAGYPRSRDGASRKYSQCSFIIDCDEAPVRAAADAAGKELGSSLDMAGLTGFVGRFITKKGYGRNFDAASIVATRREGDCTEHAVLLAALARAHGIPARVVLGLALISVGDKTSAVGHAWVEWKKGNAWLPADAALSPEELGKVAPHGKPQVTYLPVRIVDREDPGFYTALTEGAGLTQITQVLVHATSPGRP